MAYNMIIQKEGNRVPDRVVSDSDTHQVSVHALPPPSPHSDKRQPDQAALCCCSVHRPCSATSIHLPI